jgi:hypothetical protein
METNRWCAVLFHLQGHPLGLCPWQTIGERHGCHARVAAQPARQFFIHPCAPGADLAIVGHIGVAGVCLVVHPEANRNCFCQTSCPRTTTGSAPGIASMGCSGLPSNGVMRVRGNADAVISASRSAAAP